MPKPKRLESKNMFLRNETRNLKLLSRSQLPQLSSCIRRTQDPRVRSPSNNRNIKYNGGVGMESDRSFDERRCEFISDRITKASRCTLHIKNNNRNNSCLTLEGISRIDYTARTLY
ncbi:hypothetical protein K0M31_002930 [Melipona bicolor]|uniref:Uncharacterized protein n=1 Tax=Melipona bicolor TaxID=60889 RepID=A0AA40G052_9HYME|nr:hypothetical protein K0M31_002930 [Melipona bicolor]